MSEHKAGCILIIDDEPAVRELARRVLERDGQRTIAAADGREGLEKLDENPEVSILLLDSNMPGLDGRELLTSVVKRGLVIPVILSSGGGDAMSCEEFPNICGFLPKPYSVRELSKLVNRILDERIDS